MKQFSYGLVMCICFFALAFSAGAADYDFGDGSSKTLTGKAWNALQVKDYASIQAYADKCVKAFGSKAMEQQAALTDFAPADQANNFWALNDVAVCLFIQGKALREQGKNKEAADVFKQIIKEYKFAQCWDLQGWFWKVAEGAQDQLLGIEKGVDFGTGTSEALTTKAWEALAAKDYEKVNIYTDKCISAFSAKAKEMQAALKDFAAKEKAFDYWALNDVATCTFIKGKAAAEQGTKDEAKSLFNQVIKDYSFAQCWDPANNAFWPVAQGAKDQISSIDTGVDFGDMKSETLAGKAWEALGAGKYAEVDIYADKCVSMYGAKAKEMQSALKEFVDPGKNLENKDKVFANWALNDVATCLFIKGKSRYNEGKNEEAKKVFEEIISNYGFAQCYDPQGWFWHPADAAKDQILMIEKGIDFGDYTSETLTVRAWEALSKGDYDAVIVFTKKCIQMYASFADDFQKKLDGYLPKEKAFDAWALNDVGTCYFIMGEAYMGKKDPKKALEAYKMLVDKYSYSQCWDPKGWFWKPAVAARGKINKIVSETGMGM
jgi:tetratricopeptide (TPR) repeat protein